MAKLKASVLSDIEISEIHKTSLHILEKTGIVVHHDHLLDLLAQAGATVDAHAKRVRLPESLVMASIKQAGKQYILHGRDRGKTARFGYGDFVMMSSPGQYSWIDLDSAQRREATLGDAYNAMALADALENITIVGSMAQPKEVPESYRDVFLTGELLKATGKPTRCWVKNGASAKYVLELYRTVAGGASALREYPMVETLFEPISPLQLPEDGLDIMAEFVNAGQPVCVGPMAMASGTAPATLAGTLAQENAEILAGVVVTQLLGPGTPMTYGGIPHIMDPRTSICSFGSPEQGLMGVAMVQMAQSYGFPVYINVGLTDAKVPDAQAGIEKSATLLLGAQAGADTFGHCGICGTDHAGSLLWLYMDNELGHYLKRILRGFDVTAETLAEDVIEVVGPAGNFLAEEHTVNHFLHELWLSGPAWTRQSWDGWQQKGSQTFADSARDLVKTILAEHEPDPIDPGLAREIDRIVDSAKTELG